MMFAESEFSPPAQIAAWLGCLCFLLWLADLIWKLVDRSKQKPHPGEVQRESAEKFVTKDHFKQLENQNREDHDKLFSKIGGVERGAKSEVAQQVEVVRKDVMQCGRDISGLKVETQLQNQSLARVESKLDRLIERT